MNRQANAMGEALQKAREAKGLNRLGLAFHAGVNTRTIERIESGDVVPRPATLKVIADALEVEVSDLAVTETAEEAA